MQEAFFLLCLPTALPEGMAVSDWSSHTLTLKKSHTIFIIASHRNKSPNKSWSINQQTLIT